MARLDANPPLQIFRLFSQRCLLCALVVFSAYNPSGTSYYHWATATPGLTSTQIAVGILVLTGIVTILRMAFLSTGYLGIAALTLTILMSIVLGAGLDLFELEDMTFSTYAIEIVISLVLGMGLSWSFIQRRLSGERDILRTPP